MRGTWTDVPLEWLDYQEARVQALSSELIRTRGELEFLKLVLQDEKNKREIVVCDDGKSDQQVSRLLVPALPVPPPPRPEMMQ